jgi:hypothetical protein
VAIGIVLSQNDDPAPEVDRSIAAEPASAEQPPSAPIPPPQPPVEARRPAPAKAVERKKSPEELPETPELAPTDPLPPLGNREVIAETRVKPASTRSGSTRVSLARGSQGVVRVSLEPPKDEAEYRGYVAEVISDSGDSIMGHAWGPKGKPSLVLNVDARRMEAGGYRVRLHGFTESGRRRPVADYYFEVTEAEQSGAITRRSSGGT